MSDADRHRRRERRVLLGLAALVLVFMLGDASLHVCDDALHLVPLFALLVPLLLGRYVGEDLIARLRGTRATPRRCLAVSQRAHPAAPERAVREVLRGLSMARRPPPAVV